VSQRTLFHSLWNTNEQFLTKYGQGAVVTPTVEYFDLRFGNMCNLNCRSCSPRSSSQLAKEVAQVVTLQKFHTPITKDINAWFGTKMYDTNIQSQVHNIRSLYLTGGEPTIIEQNYTLLNQLVQQDYAKNIKLVINTNLTNLKNKWINVLKEFKNVTFFVSIDGYGPMQEYLRYPSKWQQIDENVTALAELNLPTFNIKPTPVIQIANLGYITELFEYFEQFNRAANKAVFDMMPIILENPKHLDCLYLPMWYKEKCMIKIDEWITANCKYQGKLFHDKIGSLRNKCSLAAPYQHQLSTFFEYNQAFDTNRNTNLAAINPELFAIHTK